MDIDSDDEKKSGSVTIDKAVSLIDDSKTSNNIKTKETGLQLALLGLAEVHLSRLSHLSGAVLRLEKEVFREENLNSMDPRKIVDLYKMSVDALNNSSSYIKGVLSTINVNNLQLSLVSAEEAQISKEDSSKKADASRVANDLLKQLASSIGNNNISDQSNTGDTNNTSGDKS